jgi:hypothetical protein
VAGNGWRILPTKYLSYLKVSLTCRKILLHGIDGFTSLPKKVVLRIFITLKNPSSSDGFEPAILGSNGKYVTTDHRKILRVKLQEFASNKSFLEIGKIIALIGL